MTSVHALGVILPEEQETSPTRPVEVCVVSEFKTTHGDTVTKLYGLDVHRATLTKNTGEFAVGHNIEIDEADFHDPNAKYGCVSQGCFWMLLDSMSPSFHYYDPLPRYLPHGLMPNTATQYGILTRYFDIMRDGEYAESHPLDPASNEQARTLLQTVMSGGIHTISRDTAHLFVPYGIIPNPTAET